MEQDQERETKILLRLLGEKIDELARGMEKMNLAEYVQMLENPKRLLYLNFLMGLARGFGMAIGFTILAAGVVWFLQRLMVLNLPLIGDFIAEIVKWVQVELQSGGPKITGGV